MTMRSKFLFLTGILLLLVLPATDSRGVDSITWQTRGPGGGGNFVAVAVKPNNPQIVLMGSDTGGIYRSTDGGSTWKMANSALVQPGRPPNYSFSIDNSSFAWDTNNPEIVYWGIFKSTDAGATWHAAVTPHLNTSVTAIDPNNSNVVYAAIPGVAGPVKVYRTDCGWDNQCLNPVVSSDFPVPNASIQSILVDPTNSSRMLACTDTGLYEGVYTGPTNWTWTKLCPPADMVVPPNPACTDLTAQNYQYQCKDLAHHSASQTLFLTVAPQVETDCSGWAKPDSWRGGVYKSTSTVGPGMSWTNINGGNESNIITGNDTNFQTGPGSWVFRYGSGQVVWDSGVGHTANGSMRIDMGSGQATAVWSGPIQIQGGGGNNYNISVWAKVAYPTVTGQCSQTPNGCSLGVSFRARIYYFTDTLGDNPLPFPGYTGQEGAQIGVFVSVASSFDQGWDNGWRKFQLLMPSRTGAASIKLLFENEGTCAGSTWVDEVEVRPVHNLPKFVGAYPTPSVEGYASLAVDATSNPPQVIYVGTRSENSNFTYFADSQGVWKTDNGGTTWTLSTRGQYQDNVRDGYLTQSKCGDGVCGGRGEDCNTCPKDCTNTYNPGVPAVGCCGNNVCSTGEHGDHTDNLNLWCLTDCPVDPEPGRSDYFDPVNSNYKVWDLAIGSGAGNGTLYFGSTQGYASFDAGANWVEISSDHQVNTSPNTITSWKPRGEVNAVLTHPVATDSRVSERLYYGDLDNSLQVSYDSGATFTKEGWIGLSITEDGCTSIVLDKDDPNKLYCGVATGDAAGGGPGISGIVQGVLNQGVNPGWTWSLLGDQSVFSGAGGIELLQDDTGQFYASVYAKGVYKLNGSTWARISDSDFQPSPTGNHFFRIVQDAASKRLYVSAGDPHLLDVHPVGEGGVWELCDAPSTTWKKISTSDMDAENISVLLPDGPNTLFVGTTYLWKDGLPHGGLYLGTRTSCGTWAWERVMNPPSPGEPSITGVTMSQEDSSILYAFSGQVCCSSATDIPGQHAGIWKSTGAGKTGTWSGPLVNNGLDYLGDSSLTFSKIPAIIGNTSSPSVHKLFAPTRGAGLFEGTISCTDPVRDFECSTRVNPSAEQLINGTKNSGAKEDIAAGTLDDTYEQFTELPVSNKQRLNVAWTFQNALPGVSYKVRVEGKKTAGGMAAVDNFQFLVAFKQAAPCTGSESYPTVIQAITSTVDNDTVLEGNVGVLASPNTVICIKMSDSLTMTDTQADSVSVDRVYLIPLQGVVAAGEGSGGVGTVVPPGTYVDTKAPDEQPTELTQTLREGPSGTNSSALSYYWRFDNVPSGSSYKLHFKGSRPNNPDGDNFKFQWATSTTGTRTDISGAVISSPTEISGGTDSGSFTPPGGTTTLYIYVKDTNSQNNKSSLDTVTIDHLTVLTVP